MNIDNLKQIGNEWQKAGKHRIYFNDLPSRLGLRTWHYNTGNISSAELDGERISNSQAKKLLSRLAGAKLWFDMADEKFHGCGLSDEEFGHIVESIKSESEQMQ